MLTFTLDLSCECIYNGNPSALWHKSDSPFNFSLHLFDIFEIAFASIVDLIFVYPSRNSYREIHFTFKTFCRDRKNDINGIIVIWLIIRFIAAPCLAKIK